MLTTFTLKSLSSSNAVTVLQALGPEEALAATVRFAAGRAETCLDAPEDLPWLVTASVLAAQQAAALALNAAGDVLPDQAGATELLLRAASVNRLPAPYTLPLPIVDRRAFEALVESRNAVVHPKARTWHVTARTLAMGLPVVTAAIRHLGLTQPVLPDLVPPRLVEALEADLAGLEALAEFLSQ